jgi:DNA-binding response OmpR family regulator
MPTILLIEDSLELSRLVSRELETAGFSAHCAADGLSGLEKFYQIQPDLVILDWMLPGMDGLVVLRRIRQSSVIPVLMLTARGDVMDKVVGLEVGADDYLVKPFEMPELMARIHALLRRAEGVRQILAQDHSPDSRKLCWRGIRLDPEAYQATLDSRPLELTHIEFELLWLLLRSPGRTFNRMYLLETIWDEPFIEGDRSVDNAVMRLRKKLEPYGDALETVRGVGYRLKPAI